MDSDTANSVRQGIIDRILGGDGFSNVVEVLQFILNLVLSVAAIVAIGALAYNITQYVRSADNPNGRRIATDNIGTCLICIAFIGGFSAIYSILVHFVF